MPARAYLCTYCGMESGDPGRPGSWWVALALAFPFVVPAAVYLAWRYTTPRRACPLCGHAQLIPLDSPLARTWRTAGWLPTASPTADAESRFERIEQAIDAIAVELDRVGQDRREPAALRAATSARTSVTP